MQTERQVKNQIRKSATRLKQRKDISVSKRVSEKDCSNLDSVSSRRVQDHVVSGEGNGLVVREEHYLEGGSISAIVWVFKDCKKTVSPYLFSAEVQNNRFADRFDDENLSILNPQKVSGLRTEVDS